MIYAQDIIDAKNAEIDRLRAELADAKAVARYETDCVEAAKEHITKLDAELAEANARTGKCGMEGHNEPCYYCGEPCNSLVGNPSRWPVALCHADEPGVVKWHHTGCVMERLAELAAKDARMNLRARAERAEARVAELEAKVKEADHWWNQIKVESAERFVRAEKAEARIAELESQCLQWMKVCTRKGEEHFLKRMWRLEREKTALLARAEKAEAELEEMDAVHLRAQRAEAALTMHKAHNYPAELDTVRSRMLRAEEALQGMLDVAEGKTRETGWRQIDAARAALGPSPARQGSIPDRTFERDLAELRAIDRTRAERDSLREALSFYADERNWHTPPHCYSAAVSDCGTKARAALAPPPAGTEE